MQIGYRGVLLAIFATLLLRCEFLRGLESEAPRQAPANTTANGTVVRPSVPPDEPVITLNGLCDNGFDPTMIAGRSPSMGPPLDGTSLPAASTGPDCKVVVTREQLEKLANAVGAKSSKGLPLAYQYADVLRFAAKGHELRIENDPRFREKARYSYLKELAQFAVVMMQEEADDFQDPELENYYKAHPDNFVQMQVSQLAVPKQKAHSDGSLSKTARPVDVAAEAAAPTT